MSDKTDKPEADPFSQMLQFYDDWTKTWAGPMSQVVSSKSFVDTMTKQMENSLAMTGLMRKQMGELMEQYLQQMSLPSRKEVLDLGERLTQIETRLDDLDAKLDQVLDGLKTAR